MVTCQVKQKHQEPWHRTKAFAIFSNLCCQIADTISNFKMSQQESDIIITGCMT